MKNTIIIRPARKEDSRRICEIYNYYIEETVITFEEEAVSSEEIAMRMEKVLSKGLPWIIAEQDGKVIGYAYSSPWRVRKAYRFCTESTVYVDKSATRQGTGEALYRELIGILQKKGYHRVYGVVALPNPGSESLHEKLGFKKAAHLTETGYKFSRWIDVGYWELALEPETES